ncbi:hypothetical protein U1Q18_040271 [Sarracenia purpurea var. burkii]
MRLTLRAEKEIGSKQGNAESVVRDHHTRVLEIYRDGQTTLGNEARRRRRDLDGESPARPRQKRCLVREAETVLGTRDRDDEWRRGEAATGGPVVATSRETLNDDTRL